MITIRDYETILGASATASSVEIRKAYRKRAMELHPDRNKSHDAHEQFILLQEAYDYFLNLKSGKVNTASSAAYYNDWYEQRREQARERARQYARMKYEEYLQSDDFKAVNALNNLFDLIGFIILLLLIVSIPVISFFKWNIMGLAVSLILILALIPFLLRFIRTAAPDFGQMKSTLQFLYRSRTFWVVVITLLNVLLIVTIGFCTLISPFILTLCFAATGIISYSISRWLIAFKNSFQTFFSWFCLAPMLLNLFFYSNYAFSEQPVTESYRYTIITQKTSQGERPTSTIKLDGNKYHEYYFLRFFMDYQNLLVGSQIHYEISEGAFGLRVMKSYQID